MLSLIVTKISNPSSSLDTAHLARRLSEAGFRGDVNADWASRHASSTDNSVYQITPDAIIAPKDVEDLQSLMRVLDEPEFRAVAITARGGGTGTNGQALNRGVVIDFRRHMHHVLDLNLDAGWVDVEPGIVLGSRLPEAAWGLFRAAHVNREPVYDRWLARLWPCQAAANLNIIPIRYGLNKTEWRNCNIGR